MSNKNNICLKRSNSSSEFLEPWKRIRIDSSFLPASRQINQHEQDPHIEHVNEEIETKNNHYDTYVDVEDNDGVADKFVKFILIPGKMQ